MNSQPLKIKITRNDIVIIYMNIRVIAKLVDLRAWYSSEMYGYLTSIIVNEYKVVRATMRVVVRSDAKNYLSEL